VKKLFRIFLTWCLLFSFTPTVALAKEYGIRSVNIDAHLNADGSMDVTEARTYDFNGSFSYAYQYLYTQPKQESKPGRTEAYQIENFKLCDAEQCYLKVEPLFGAATDFTYSAGNFYVQPQSNQYYLKWFYKALDESKIFTLSYTVTNAITQHTDVDELYWQFIGDKWDLSQGNVDVVLT